MDLSTLDPSKGGADLHLRHPTNGALLYDGDRPITITLASADSAQFRNAQRAVQNGRLKRKSSSITIEELEADSLEMIAAATLGWSGIDLDGKPLEYSRNNAKVLYQRLPWVREQADEFMGDRANFLSSAAKNSVLSPEPSTKEQSLK